GRGALLSDGGGVGVRLLPGRAPPGPGTPSTTGGYGTVGSSVAPVRKEGSMSPDATPDPLRSAADALGERADALAAAVKPRLRGWIHAGIAPLALVAGVVLVVLEIGRASCRERG